jgi:hypothetical protein
MPVRSRLRSTLLRKAFTTNVRIEGGPRFDFVRPRRKHKRTNLRIFALGMTNDVMRSG